MRTSLLLSAIGAFAVSDALRLAPRNDSSSLIVSATPDYVRPYIVRAYTLPGLRLGPQVYRFPVTGPSSDYAFTLISTAAPSSTDLGVLPHLHQAHYENFYCLRGRFALWTSKDGETDGRILTPGDYGAVPHNTTHTFQMLDPFVEQVGVIQPGGFEKLFYFLAQENYTSPTYAPYPQGNYTTPGGDAATISALTALDVYAELTFSPDFAFDSNGVSGNESKVWHDGENALATDSSTPFFVAKGYGPKYLATTSGNGSYLVIEPFITSVQSGGNFTEGTITISELKSGAQADSYTFTGHTALEVVDGQVGVSIGGYDGSVTLAIGDVVFVPAGTQFSFWGEAAYSKVLYVGQGTDTLDAKLIKSATTWDSVLWPKY